MSQLSSPSTVLVLIASLSYGTVARVGTCDELLRAGQANLVLINGHRERVVPRVRPAVRCADSALVLELRDSSTIAKVFVGRPRQATIEAGKLHCVGQTR